MTKVITLSHNAFETEFLAESREVKDLLLLAKLGLFLELSYFCRLLPNFLKQNLVEAITGHQLLFHYSLQHIDDNLVLQSYFEER